MLVDQHHIRHVAGSRHHVVGQRAGQQLAIRIISDVLKQYAAEALCGAAGNLALDQQWVDDDAAIMGDRIFVDPDLPEIRSISTN